MAGVRLSVLGDGPPSTAPRECSIVICNHHCRLDWMFLWCLFVRYRQLGGLKICLKSELKRAPFFGWGMQAFLFIFFDRNDREADLRRLTSTLAYCQSQGDPLTLLIFPEGTDIAPINRVKMEAYSKATGLPNYKHVLHPRAAGFTAAVRSLGSKLDAVYDLTVNYTLHPAIAADDDPRPNEVWLAKGAWPRTVDLRVERHEASALPADDEGITTWLRQRWERKEEMLADVAAGRRPKRFLEDSPKASPKASPKTSPTNSPSRDASATPTAGAAGSEEADGMRAPLPVYVLTCIGWALAVYAVGHGLIHTPWVRWYTAAAVACWVAITKHGGLEEIEMMVMRRYAAGHAKVE